MRIRLSTEMACFTGHSSLESRRHLIIIWIEYLAHTHSRESKMSTQQPLYGVITIHNGMILCKVWQEHAILKLQWHHLQSFPTLSRASFLHSLRMSQVYTLFVFSYVESLILSQLTIASFSSMIITMDIRESLTSQDSALITNFGQ